MNIDWSKLSDIELNEFLNSYDINKPSKYAELLYEHLLRNGQPIPIIIQDLIFASNFKKVIPQKYQEEKLINMTPEQKQRFADAFKLSINDPQLKQRIIRILRFLNAIEIKSVNPAAKHQTNTTFTGVPDTDYQILLRLDWAELNKVIVNKYLQNMVSKQDFWRNWLELHMNITSDDPNLNYRAIATTLNKTKNIDYEEIFEVAIEDNDVTIVKLLLDNKRVNPNNQLVPTKEIISKVRAIRPGELVPPIYTAITLGHNEIVKLLLTAGVADKLSDYWIDNISMSAIINSNIEGLRLLMTNNNFNERPIDEEIVAALRIKNDQDRVNILKILLASPNIEKSILMSTLLDSFNDLEIVNMILNDPRIELPSDVIQQVRDYINGNKKHYKISVILGPYY